MIFPKMIFPMLFSSQRIGSMEVKNRFMVPALATNFANPDGTVSQQLIDYYTARAKGGFGLIVVEVAAVDEIGKAIPFELGVWSDEHIGGLRELVKSVHKYGAKIALQLHHCGRQTIRENIGGAQPVAPSAIACPVRKVMPHELTTEETYTIIDKFKEAAVRARKAGFDAVEFNGAHGYLIAQFMSEYANKRIDEFGGNFSSRMRFALEIVRKVRREMGSRFPLIFRISGDEKVHGGRTIDETRAAVRLLEQNGIDAVSISAGTYASLQWMSGSGAFPPGYIVSLAEEVKKSVKIPVITAGRINHPYLAEDIVESGKADFVGFGRTSLADPEFPNKVAENAVEEIAPCIACLQGCLGYLFDPGIQKISCLVNPFVGREGTLKIEEVKKPKKVMIVGGGPGGLEAAWIAAQRGHHVTCYEKDKVLGGQFKIGGIPSTKGELLSAIKYYITMGKKFGVQYRLGTEVTPEIIKSEKPDTLLLATGAIPLIPVIKGINNPQYLQAVDVLSGKRPFGQKVLVAGGGLLGAETAEFMGEHGAQVTIIEAGSEIARDVPDLVRLLLLRRLKQYGVLCLTNMQVKEFLDDGAVCDINDDITSIYSRFGTNEQRITGFDSIVLAFGSMPFNPLEESVKEIVPEVYVLGDALKAGKAITAIADAAKIAALI